MGKGNEGIYKLLSQVFDNSPKLIAFCLVYIQKQLYALAGSAGKKLQIILMNPQARLPNLGPALLFPPSPPSSSPHLHPWASLPAPVRTKPEEPVPPRRLTLLQGPEGTNSPHSGPEQPHLELLFHPGTWAPFHLSPEPSAPAELPLHLSSQGWPSATAAGLTLLPGRGGRRALPVMPHHALKLGHNSSSDIFPVLQINFSDGVFKRQSTLC